MEKEEVRRAVLAIMEGKIPLNSSWCKVKKVNVSAKTCDIIFDDDEDLVIADIMLGYDKSGVVVFPKVNTDVLVMFINNTKTQGAVVAVEETENVEIMGVEHGGVPISQKIADRLNTLENKLNSFITKYNAHTHPYVNVTTPAVTSVTTTIETGGLQNTTAAQIENTKVKHGKG